jgi:hypothetical protein
MTVNPLSEIVYSITKHVRNRFHTLEFKFSMEYLKMMKNTTLIEIKEYLVYSVIKHVRN